MDETPYLNDEAMPVLDSITSFLKRNPKITITIIYADESTANFDSCVPCSFELTVKEYLVIKGIKEERMFIRDNDNVIDPALGRYKGFQMIIN